MNIIKNITRILFLPLSFLTLAGCNKYLDIKPVGTVIPTTPADFRGLMVSAYNGFPDHKSYLNLRTDELDLDEFSEDIASVKDIYIWNDLNPDRTTTPFAWQTFYKSIFYANQVIDQAKEKAGDTKEVQQIRGEAYLLRAYAHFELLNMYAPVYNKTTSVTDRGVPISTKLDLEQPYVPATVETVYQQIFQDIQEGEALLNETSETPKFRYRFTKTAAKALEARIYLYRGEWELASQKAAAALALHGDLENLNKDDAHLPNDYRSVEQLQALENVFNSTLQNSSRVSPLFAELYDKQGDMRYARYFQDNDGTLVGIKGGSTDFLCSFRTGELYLIQAEALAQQGKIAEALSSLETLGKNRLTPSYLETWKSTIANLSASALLQEIYQERAREMALEGLRWYDLKRTTQPSIEHTYQDKSFVLTQGDPRYVIRYPREATANNPNL
ncbi:SusD family protein [bacterium A37T11]|nr:SusD family protein [bacterium A37T11]